MASAADTAPSPSAQSDASGLAWLESEIHHAAHLLPAQGPITAFVHHNTLHAFEEYPFDEAVVRGGAEFDCHPYLPEEDYREALAKGRIFQEDIEAALREDLGDRADEWLGFLGTRYDLRLAMLAHPLRTGPTAELRWVVAETDALRSYREEVAVSVRNRVVHRTRHWVMRDLRNDDEESAEGIRVRQVVQTLFHHFDATRLEKWSEATWEAFTLHFLWLLCREGVEYAGAPADGPLPPVRLRDLLLQATGRDPDVYVDELLIRFCGVFIDQGFAPWPLPRRSDGFLSAFCELYGTWRDPPDRWLAGLSAELKRLKERRLSPLESIAESLEALGVSREETPAFIRQTLLALRGFAGMIWQLESRGDRAAEPVPSGTLIEYLAVRLILDRLAASWILRESLDYRGALADWKAQYKPSAPHAARVRQEQRAFIVFQLAQLLGWEPEMLSRLVPEEWQRLVSETEAFSSLERRRVYHHAFERRYYLQTLDAVALHAKKVRHEGNTTSSSPAYQVVCCIDEREESFRRHLEELDPECETLGAAGFFGVAMYYKGISDAHFTPLCPVAITPKHYVVERPAGKWQALVERWKRQRRAFGTVTHRVHLGSRTFAGGWLAAVLGSLASLPLVMRILFPRATAQLRRFMGDFVRPQVSTELLLERSHPEPGPEDGHIGYTVEEMADIVTGLLRAMGLTQRWSPLVVMVGHGSSSLNNPHEAAHNCGACAGGLGGPNARAFALMANDPRVRKLVADRGVEIPDATIFVGAYHDTCDDRVIYYDLDRLPESHRELFERARASLDLARCWNAHERCRRFESAELTLSPEDSLRHVEGRAEDLSQVRPEYGHATNALCFVGQRGWSRGLFLDRRCFLQSYDPAQDDEEGTVLAGILSAVIPVCAGINLEYYFSFVDPTGYGCGTKLPHNVTSLLGVMNGAASDLRPGLPWQMVEIHEPLRLLFVIETTPEVLLKVMAGNPAIRRLVEGEWVFVATLDAEAGTLKFYRRGRFEPYEPTSERLPTVARSLQWYRGWRDHLGYASVTAAAPKADHARETTAYEC